MLILIKCSLFLQQVRLVGCPYTAFVDLDAVSQSEPEAKLNELSKLQELYM